MGCKLLVLVAAICSLGYCGDLDVSFEPAEIVLNPGSRKTLTVKAALYEGNGQHTTVELDIGLKDAKNICLSLKSEETLNITDGECRSSCSVTIMGSAARTIGINFDYDSTHSGVIPRDRSYAIDIQVKSSEVSLIQLGQFKLIVSDGRKVGIGFDGPVYMLTAPDIQLPVLRYGDKSLRIDEDLNIDVILWWSSDGINWEKAWDLLNIKESLTEASNWTISVGELEVDKLYQVSMTTELSDVVELLPNTVKIYPSNNTLACGQLADKVRNRTSDPAASADGGDVDGYLSHMCALLRHPDSCTVTNDVNPTPEPEVETSPMTTTSAEATAVTTVATTVSSAEQASTTMALDLTEVIEADSSGSGSTEPIIDDNIKSNKTGSGNGADTTNTNTQSINTDPPTSSPEPDDLETTSTQPVDSGASPSVNPKTIEDDDNNNDEDNSDTTELEQSDTPIMWYAFFGLFSLMVVGVAIYILFNHHAKVKVYLFQLVGKSNSTLSPSLGRRGKPGPKYTPLPTNVRETMLHQD